MRERQVSAFERPSCCAAWQEEIRFLGMPAVRRQRLSYPWPAVVLFLLSSVRPFAGLTGGVAQR